MLDEELLEEQPYHRQQLGMGGTHQGTYDTPTIGELISRHWPEQQYRGGFEGLVPLSRFTAATRLVTLRCGALPDGGAH